MPSRKLPEWLSRSSLSPVSRKLESQRNGPQQVKAQQAKANSAIADVLQAQAKVKQAELNLSYTRITAPTAGVVNKKNVQVGANLGIGQDLLTIIPLTDLLGSLRTSRKPSSARMKVGQEVDLKVDALGGRHFTGQGHPGRRSHRLPASRSSRPRTPPATTSRSSSAFPSGSTSPTLEENGDYALRPGFSVTPEVRVK